MIYFTFGNSDSELTDGEDRLDFGLATMVFGDIQLRVSGLTRRGTPVKTIIIKATETAKQKAKTNSVATNYSSSNSHDTFTLFSSVRLYFHRDHGR